MVNLIPPRVHLNGSGAERLIDQYQKLSNALLAATCASFDAEPNARDYYIISHTAYSEAKTAHDSMSKTLAVLKAQVDACIQNIQDQVDERKKR